MTQASTDDIPSYDQFVRNAGKTNADALNRMNAETGSLITASRHAIAARALDLLRAHEPKPDEDRAELAASLHEDLRRVRAEFSDPRMQGVHTRIACDLLRLYRVCPRERCRRAESCRGHARCFKNADVPEPVFRRVSWLMMAARLPWVMSGRAEERVAYESWIAGIEAGGNARCVRAAYSASPLPWGERSTARSAVG